MFLKPQALALLALGFAAGLPLLLVFGSLSFWLREAGIERPTIALISWVGFAYSLKFAWAPLVDSVRLPLLHRWLGRRRSWMLLAQAALMVGIAGMAIHDPQQALAPLVAWALFTAFASATQDIVIDAYRIEVAPVDLQAALAATYQAGYRLGMIVSGAGTLYLAAWFDPDPATYVHESWRSAYLAMALIMGCGVLTTLLIGEPETAQRPPVQRSFGRWFAEAVVAPFTDFFARYGRIALWLLALIACYRITDIVMGVIANVFYQDMGYSKAEVASVAKLFGVLLTLAGAFVGGALAPQLGANRLLLLGAVCVVGSNLLFAGLALLPPSRAALVAVISADNFSGGLAASAFIAYLSALTSVRFSATQYALFSSLMTLLPKFVAGGSGWAVDTLGYPGFFIACSSLGLPVIGLILYLSRVLPEPVVRAPSDSAAGSGAP